MKIKKKGKIYPSPSSSSSSSSSAASADNRDIDVFSVLKLLPVAILTLASVLSLEDREVLAYMITRSMMTTTNSNSNHSSSLPQDSKKKSSKKSPISNTHNQIATTSHKVPIFDCDCFNCYTSYWFRWDSSPNRELIHQVIEAFEDHLSTGEQSRKSARGKKRDKGSHCLAGKPVIYALGRPPMAEMGTPPPEGADESSVVAAVSSSNDDISPVSIPERAADGDEVKGNDVPAVETDEAAVVVGSLAVVSNHKGLARKVLPDVLGILNSRLWSLWGPNV